MKRFHVHVHVDDLEKNIRFYSTLFDARPAIVKPDYAKWMLEDPRLNFAISTGSSHAGIGHLGLQVDGPQELAEIEARGDAAELGGVAERAAHCCYAKSNKHWFTDPQGIAWETFESFGMIDEYGADREAEVENSACSGSSCCA
ncbi:MAG TPA: ArsI/CadI family heavy metal resistance metalloenzyme [Steroidobacteraceae bacterium]|nr:ArsI/CadI family heavy metal resistance metalloenzyme [Steroidobacteraceae bacterium]